MTISQELAERVCPCAAQVPGRVYPLAQTPPGAEVYPWVDLVHEVAVILMTFEMPEVERDSADWYALSWCLWRYVYGYRARGRHGRDPGADAAELSGGEGPATETGAGGGA